MKHVITFRREPGSEWTPDPSFDAFIDGREHDFYADNDDTIAHFVLELSAEEVAMLKGLGYDVEPEDQDLPACGDPDCNACPRPSQV